MKNVFTLTHKYSPRKIQTNVKKKTPKHEMPKRTNKPLALSSLCAVAMVRVKQRRDHQRSKICHSLEIIFRSLRTVCRYNMSSLTKTPQTKRQQKGNSKAQKCRKASISPSSCTFSCRCSANYVRGTEKKEPIRSEPLRSNALP